MLHRHAGPAVAGSYLTGSIGGALTSITALFVIKELLSRVPESAGHIVGSCGIVILVIHALGLVCLDLPPLKSQIQRETFTDAAIHAAFRFAFELCTGVRSYITSVSRYALAILVLLRLPSGLGAASAGSAALGYGVGRSVVVASQDVTCKASIEHPSHWLRTADIVALFTALPALIVLQRG